MRTRILAASLIALAISSAEAQQPTSRPARAAAAITTAARWDRAYYAWDAGKYDEALADLKIILTAPDADAYHDRIAELTGERWLTTQVQLDVRSPVWAPDGRHLAYEVNTGGRRATHVRQLAGDRSVVTGPGFGPSFSADGRFVAFNSLLREGPRIAMADLTQGGMREIPIDASAITGVTLFGRNPARVAVLVGTIGDSTARLLVRDVSGTDGTWSQVPISGRQPVQLLRSPDGSRLLVQLGQRGAFARAIPGFAGGSRTDAFAEVMGTTLGPIVMGTMPTWSATGNAFAWVEESAEGARVRVKHGTSEPTDAVTITNRFQAPALSPDGRTVVFGQMLREDWELFRVPAAGGEAPTRITREIQHDHTPRFVTNDILLAVMGEGRHQRSYLYDLRSGTRTRFFHNNSVRTVAPEYEWAVSPDGSKVAIVSERDGDTVTPHRHLYLTDLTKPVTRAQLIARVDSNLTAERALRENGRRIFAPIAAQVRAAVNDVSVGRIYEYEKALFSFDSKNITQPGNWLATNWLEEKYRSFGYQTRLQRFTTLQGREIEVANVLATIPGTVNPELVYVVGAHFDSRAEGPGADDNTSGTAMILEAARVLSTRPLPATVMFVAFTGEESGLRGAREFGRRMKDSITVVGALNNDMMGWSNDHRLDNTIRYSNPGLRDVQHAAAIHFSELITYDAFYYKSTDAQALYDAWGDIIAGIGSYPILGNPHYHQVHDVLETINHRQLAETSKTTIATIMLMASSPSRLTGLVATGNTVTWDAARERGIARYMVTYGPPATPTRYNLTTTNPRATLRSLQPGWHVAVKAVNAQGLEGWDWARAVVR